MSRFVLLLVVLCAACSGSSKEHRDICERAATKYEGCLVELLGPEAKQLASGKREAGVAACASDDQTVELYKACLPKSSCDEFMECMERYARANGP